MNTVQSVEKRKAEGRAAREKVARKVHKAVGDVDRDLIALLESNSAGRVPRLVALRYGRMLASPFAFFRGSAIIQAHDLAGTPDSGMPIQICGDCHLVNFGGFATPERSLIFDVNDFDETALGPWEWDLKRLVASVVVAGRHLGHGAALAREFAYATAESYRERIAEYAQMGALEVWYQKITFDDLLNTYSEGEARKRVKRGIEKAATRTHESMLSKLAEFNGTTWKIRDVPPGVFHIRGEQTLFDPEDDLFKIVNGHEAVHKVFDEYLATLSSERRELLGEFEYQDIAFKVVGVGSVGTRCMILLLVDHFNKPLFIQCKEASQSVIAQFYKSRSHIRHQGQRVVDGQRRMQAASDPFLGWSTGPFGRHMYLRQLRDMKVSPEIDVFSAELLRQYGELCGWVLARAHAKAGGNAVQLTTYMGKSDQLSLALTDYAVAYADQVEKDFDVFQKACRDGRLDARTDADLAADFVV